MEVLSHPARGNFKCCDRDFILITSLNNGDSEGQTALFWKTGLFSSVSHSHYFKNNIPTKVSTHFTTFIIKYSNFKSSDFSCLKTPPVDRDTVRLPAGLKPSAGFHRMSETTGWREMLGDETHYMHHISSLQRKCFKEFLHFVRGFSYHILCRTHLQYAHWKYKKNSLLRTLFARSEVRHYNTEETTVFWVDIQHGCSTVQDIWSATIIFMH